MYGFLPNSTRAYAGTIEGRPPKEILVGVHRYGAVDGDQGTTRSMMICKVHLRFLRKIVLGFAIVVAALRLRRARARQARDYLHARHARDGPRCNHRIALAELDRERQVRGAVTLHRQRRSAGRRVARQDEERQRPTFELLADVAARSKRRPESSAVPWPPRPRSLPSAAGATLPCFVELLIEILDLPLQHAAQLLRRILSEQKLQTIPPLAQDRRPAAPRCCRTTAPWDDSAPSSSAASNRRPARPVSELRRSSPALRRDRSSPRRSRRCDWS